MIVHKMEGKTINIYSRKQFDEAKKLFYITVQKLATWGFSISSRTSFVTHVPVSTVEKARRSCWIRRPLGSNGMRLRDDGEYRGWCLRSSVKEGARQCRLAWRFDREFKFKCYLLGVPFIFQSHHIFFPRLMPRTAFEFKFPTKSGSLFLRYR